MNKICGYSCEHNKGGVCQITMCDKKIVMTTTTNEPFEKRFNVKYDEQGVENFTRWLDPTIEEYKKEIDRLNNIIDEIKKLCDENTNGIDDDGYDDAYYDRVYVREIEEIIENELKKEKDI